MADTKPAPTQAPDQRFGPVTDPSQIWWRISGFDTSMVQTNGVIKALKRAGLRDRVKAIVGRAPVAEEYAQDVSGNGCAPSASVAVEKARELWDLAQVNDS